MRRTGPERRSREGRLPCEAALTAECGRPVTGAGCSPSLDPRQAQTLAGVLDLWRAMYPGHGQGSLDYADVHVLLDEQPPAGPLRPTRHLRQGRSLWKALADRAASGVWTPPRSLTVC